MTSWSTSIIHNMYDWELILSCLSFFGEFWIWNHSCFYFSRKVGLHKMKTRITSGIHPNWARFFLCSNTPTNMDENVQFCGKLQPYGQTASGVKCHTFLLLIHIYSYIVRLRQRPKYFLNNCLTKFHFLGFLRSKVMSQQQHIKYKQACNGLDWTRIN